MPFQPEAAFADMARGDAGALDFLRAFYVYAHTLDDLIDRDKPIAADLAVWSQANLVAIVTSDFFLKHRAFLMPVIWTSVLAFIASEDKKNVADVLERIAAQVLKSEYLNVFLAVCFCVGGFEHALAMSRKYREYSFDAEPVKL